jgi:hypothetical protein
MENKMLPLPDRGPSAIRREVAFLWNPDLFEEVLYMGEG